MKKSSFRFVFCLLTVLAMFPVCVPVCAQASGTEAEPGGTKSIRIIATSDLHGKMLPWDYALNEESPSGSMVQLASAIREYRNDNTLLVDAGDTIQDNFSEIFFDSGDVHPMVQALNVLDYDVWTVGNHEFNFGMEITKKTIADLNAQALAGNVFDENGDPIAEGCVFFEKDGVRVAVIGMVTPNIVKWDAVNLAGCTVTDPLEETRKIIDRISGQYDVLVGVYHMGINDEFEVENSGVTDILNACPEFDVMVSSHEHKVIEGEEINGVLVVQNLYQAQTMSVIDLTLEPDGDGWKVQDKSSRIVETAGYDPDPDLSALLEKYDRAARENAETVIGVLEGSALAPESEIAEIPTAQIRDTALIDLINRVQMYYSGAPVSASALFSSESNMYPGDIRRCDISLIYKYVNTLYKLQMTGAQLKKYMEWSAGYYNTWHPGDLTISFNPDIRAFNYDMFDGVNYEINLSREPGNRIENLTWPDGTSVKDTDVFEIAVNNYRANSNLLAPGVIYEENEMPKLLETDMHSEIGGIREMIADYIINVEGGVIKPSSDDNWHITGCDWDQDLHQKTVELISEGLLAVPSSEDGQTPNVKPVTQEDVRAVMGG